ncbi:hypothetical protein [Lentilactobacillus kosonis]|uniref:hypothetical protein n=1 Tax=Lentilactobacillus kosonis TaxID=2810561 RepID=UPI000F618F8B|nr:hypothetical protein [Lentilactobacillus kosonis]
MKSSKVFVKPYDFWNHFFIWADTIELVLLISVFFFQSFLLSVFTGILIVLTNVGYISMLWLNASKKRRLNTSRKYQNRG